MPILFGRRLCARHTGHPHVNLNLVYRHTSCLLIACRESGVDMCLSLQKEARHGTGMNRMMTIFAITMLRRYNDETQQKKARDFKKR